MGLAMPNRLAYIVDGFNLYHSILEALQRSPDRHMKWLDLRGLFGLFTPNFGRDATLEKVYYFSAFQNHLAERRPDTVNRHRLYVEALSHSGVKIELARFKKREVWCRNCKQQFFRHEEKETDVAVACKLLELFARDACDTAVLVSGDTDLLPAIRTALDLFPQKHIAVAFPYKRKNLELAAAAPVHFRLKPERYAEHQLPNPLVLPDGREIYRPATW